MEITLTSLERAVIVDNNTSSMISAAHIIEKCQNTLEKVDCVESTSEEEGAEIQYVSCRYAGKVLSSRPPIREESFLSPSSLLAYLLAHRLRMSVPQELQMQGLTMKTQDNKCHFCISGSFSLDDAQTLISDLKERCHLLMGR